MFYDPGVGTLERPNPWKKWRQDLHAIFGLATGYGLDDNILNSYEFIVDNYREGDDIYLFGFSRGAYTVRALAGLIHKIGLIAKPQSNLAGSGLTAYKQFSSDFGASGRRASTSAQFTDGGAADVTPSKEDQAAQYARILSVKWPTIKFVGVWDTVASVIVPRPDRLYYAEPADAGLRPAQSDRSRSFARRSSIDERRRMFRLQPWDEGGKFWPHRYAPKATWKDQDSLQVWFAGVHSDIGGGYPEKQSALSKYPLLWMIEEAVQAGLKVDRRTVNQLGWGRKRKNSPFDYVAPGFLPDPGNPDSAAWQPHNSMNAGWRAHRVFSEDGQVQGMAGAQIGARLLHPGRRAAPDPGRRLIHQSAIDKIAQDRHLQAGEYPEELPGGPAAAPNPPPDWPTMPRMTTGR